MDGDASGVITVSSPRTRSRLRSVRINDVEIRTTSADALKLAAVSDGDVLSGAELDRLLRDVEPEAAMNRALRLLGHRERSVTELVSRLTDDGYPATVVEMTTTRLADYGYLDDARFAEGYVRSKVAAGWGRRRIARGLTEKGVDEDLASRTLDAHVAEADELDRACEAITTLDVSSTAGASRALRRLVTAGFSYDVARKAIEARRASSGRAGRHL